MECGRLIKLIKSWYLQVQNEALAPARMVSFMEKHAEECDVCLADPDLHREMERITLIVCPPSKAPKPLKTEEGGEEVEFRMPASAPHRDVEEEEEREEGDELEEELDEDLDEDLEEDDDF